MDVMLGSSGFFVGLNKLGVDEARNATSPLGLWKDGLGATGGAIFFAGSPADLRFRLPSRDDVPPRLASPRTWLLSLDVFADAGLPVALATLLALLLALCMLLLPLLFALPWLPWLATACGCERRGPLAPMAPLAEDGGTIAAGEASWVLWRCEASPSALRGGEKYDVAWQILRSRENSARSIMPSPL